MNQKISKILFAFVLGAFFVLPGKGLAFSGSNNQYYDVVFDRNGEAAVIAKLTYLNVSEKQMTDLELKIPADQVRIINLVQGQDATCYYDNNGGIEPLPYLDSQSSANSSGSSTSSSTSSYPDCYSPQYAGLKYDKSFSDGVMDLKITLAKAIDPQSSTTILVYYKAMGYATKQYGIYNFAFQTIKSNYDVDNIGVSVDVQDELYLKEGKSVTNSTPVYSSLTTASVGTFSASPTLKTLSDSVAYHNEGFYKSTSGLDPNGNFTVNGKYFESYLWGNWLSVVGAGLVLLVLIGLVIYIIKKEKEG